MVALSSRWKKLKQELSMQVMTFSNQVVYGMSFENLADFLHCLDRKCDAFAGVNCRYWSLMSHLSQVCELEVWTIVLVRVWKMLIVPQLTRFFNDIGIYELKTQVGICFVYSWGKSSVEVRLLNVAMLSLWWEIVKSTADCLSFGIVGCVYMKIGMLQGLGLKIYYQGFVVEG